MNESPLHTSRAEISEHSYIHFLPKVVPPIIGDICVNNSLTNFFANADGCTCVIHGAGVVSVASRPGSRLYQIHVGRTWRGLLQCMEYAGWRVTIAPRPIRYLPRKRRLFFQRTAFLLFRLMCMPLKTLLKQGQEAPVGLGLHFFIGNEAQGRTADAVAHAVGRLGSTSEHMIEVGVSGATADLRAAQPLSSSAAASRIGSTLRYMAYPSFSRR